MKLCALIVSLVLLSGCCASEAALNTAQVAAAGNDRYTDLSVQILDGSVDDTNGPAVNEEDWAETPASVREFMRKLLDALHTNRFAWHSILFNLDVGPDPNTLALEPVALPATTDEDDDLLEEE